MFELHIDPELSLKLLNDQDTEELFALTDSSRTYLRHWLPWVDFTTKVEDTKSFIEMTMKQFASNNGFQTGIWYKGRVAGVIGFHKIDWLNKAASIGYWLGEQFQGHGLMTKACIAYINYAFNELQLNRIEIRCAVLNVKSRAIPERLGFVNEGTIRDGEWLYDHFVDHIVYGMLKKDWKEKHL